MGESKRQTQPNIFRGIRKGDVRSPQRRSTQRRDVRKGPIEGVHQRGLSRVRTSKVK